MYEWLAYAIITENILVNKMLYIVTSYSSMAIAIMDIAFWARF